MTAIAIDLGDKRCGLAVEVEGFSMAKETVARVKIISTIKKYLQEYCGDTIIVGLPYDLYGKKIQQLEKTQKFIEKLKIIFPDKEILGVDERFTSFEADITLKELGVVNRQGKKDDISAQIILATYLGRKRGDKNI